MLRAVCFDLYETLVTEAGVPKPSKDTWAARLGLPGEQFWAAWRARHDARMTGADADFAVGAAKPDRAIYQHACRVLGVVPEEALFVGDGGSDELAGVVKDVLASPLQS